MMNRRITSARRVPPSGEQNFILMNSDFKLRVLLKGTVVFFFFFRIEPPLASTKMYFFWPEVIVAPIKPYRNPLNKLCDNSNRGLW